MKRLVLIPVFLAGAFSCAAAITIDGTADAE
jgi:hypothetical protein